MEAPPLKKDMVLTSAPYTRGPLQGSWGVDILRDKSRYSRREVNLHSIRQVVIGV